MKTCKQLIFLWIQMRPQCVKRAQGSWFTCNRNVTLYPRIAIWN